MHLPLLKSEHSSAPLVWHDGIAITRGDFARTAQRLAARLPDACHVINLCAGRLNFMLGLAASALRGQTTLLPPNQTPAALQRLQQEYPQHHVLDDSVLAQLTTGFETRSDNQGAVATSPPMLIDADRTVITLFTSGSTGTPQAQTKTWRSLTCTAQLDTQRFTPTPV